MTVLSSLKKDELLRTLTECWRDPDLEVFRRSSAEARREGASEDDFEDRCLYARCGEQGGTGTGDQK